MEKPATHDNTRPDEKLPPGPSDPSLGKLPANANFQHGINLQLLTPMRPKRQTSRHLFLALSAALMAAIPCAARPIYVMSNESKVGIYDSDTGAAINASLITGLAPSGELAGVGNILYIASYSTGKVLTYNATTGEVINANFIVGLNGPVGIAVNGNDLLITNYGNAGGTTVGKYNATTGAVVDANFITNAATPIRALISGSDLYITNYWGNSVGKYNVQTGATINAGFVSGIANPRGTAVFGNQLYVTIGSYYGDDTIRTYNATTGAVINNAFITSAGSATALEIIGNTLYSAQSANGRIAKYDATTGALIDANFITGLTGNISMFVFLAPEIEVRQPASTNLVDGGTKNFGTVAVNGSSSLVFTIKNTGQGDLTGLGILIDGADEELFTVTAQPTAPVAGPLGTTTFAVQFAPTSAGPKTAALHLTSNDADENPFDLTLLGNVTAIEAWRQTHFGSIENSGDGADLNDYDHDGLVNLTEFAFGFNPKVSGDGQLPVGQIIGGNFVVYFNPPASVSGITYGAEWSTALLPATWTVIPDTGIPPQHAFSVPIGSNKRMFMRFRISNP